MLSSLLFLPIFLLSVFSQNFCPADNAPFVNLTISLPKISPSDEVISGVNYGKLFAIPNGLWMLKPLSTLQSMTLIASTCPNGWLPPTKDDLTNLLNFANSYNKSILTDPTLFNMNTSLIYVSNTKVYPNLTNSSDARSFYFYALRFSVGTPFIGTTYSYYDVTKSRVFCVHSRKSINNTLSSQSGLQVLGLTNKDLIKGFRYSFSLANSNLLAYQWNVDNKFNSSKDLNIIPMRYGGFQIQAKGTLFDGTTIGSCINVWVRNYTGSEANTSFTQNDIHGRSYLNRKFYRANSLHFTAGSAPIAPIDTGGVYILYSDFATREFFVKQIDNDGNEIQEFEMNRFGFAMDIVSVPWGFIFLAFDFNDTNKLYLYGHDTSLNTKRFERILMDNPPNATNYTKDQIIFFQDSAGTPLFGMDSMFQPSSGKLTLARDIVLAFFSRYNFFGFKPDGTRNDHTGDIYLSFNLSGLDEKVSFSWGASHSLSQNMLYNGENAFSTALGDAYPINIMVSKNDVSFNNGLIDPKTGLYNRLNYNSNSSLITGIMPGNGMGFSCGRMGSLSFFGDGAYNVLSYARRPCNMSLEGFMKNSTIDQMGLVFFDNNLNKLADVSLGPGKWINQVQSVKYGMNMFFTFVYSNRTDRYNQSLTSITDKTDIMSVMLLNNAGNVLSSPFNLTKSILPASDDLRILNDGRVAWTYVDENYTLTYYYLTKPQQTPTNEVAVLNNGFYQNGSSFYLIDPKDNNTYVNSLSVARSVASENDGNFGFRLKFSLIVLALIGLFI